MTHEVAIKYLLESVVCLSRELQQHRVSISKMDANNPRDWNYITRAKKRIREIHVDAFAINQTIGHLRGTECYPTTNSGKPSNHFA